MLQLQDSTIGDCCEVIAGQSPEGKYYNSDGRGMPFYQGKKDFGEKFLEEPSIWTTETPKVARKSDILMSVRAPVGPVNFATQDVCIGRGLAAIRSRGPLEVDFLFYQLLHLQPKIAGKEGAVFASINKSEIAALPIVVGPLSEQRRIVAILDEAFEGIATAKANAEKNLQNARELLTSTLATVFNTAWPLVRIEDACESITDCVNKTAPICADQTPYKMLRTTNIRNGLVSLDSVNYVTEDVYKAWTRRQVPQRGDVILTREAPMGEVGMLESDDPVFLGQRLVAYRADASKLDARFLLYALQSDPLQRQIRAKASGSTVQHMRVPDSKNLQLPLPELVAQRKAVELLDAMREQANHLRGLYSSKLAALDELKKSLLHQAFTGQL